MFWAMATPIEKGRWALGHLGWPRVLLWTAAICLVSFQALGPLIRQNFLVALFAIAALVSAIRFARRYVQSEAALGDQRIDKGVKALARQLPEGERLRLGLRRVKPHDIEDMQNAKHEWFASVGAWRLSVLQTAHEHLGEAAHKFIESPPTSHEASSSYDRSKWMDPTMTEQRQVLVDTLYAIQKIVENPKPYATND